MSRTFSFATCANAVNWLPNGRYALKSVTLRTPAAFIASRSFVMPSRVMCPFIQCHHVPTASSATGCGAAAT